MGERGMRLGLKCHGTDSGLGKHLDGVMDLQSLLLWHKCFIAHDFVIEGETTTDHEKSHIRLQSYTGKTDFNQTPLLRDANLHSQNPQIENDLLGEECRMFE